MKPRSQPVKAEPQRPAGSPWSFADLAAFLGVSAKHLIRLADGGKLKDIRLGRRRMVPDSEARRIAEEGC